MGKRGVTVLLTVLLAICLTGMEQIKSRRETEAKTAEAAVRPEEGRENPAGAIAGAGTGREEPAETVVEPGSPEEPEKLVALTFDDGPHSVYTKKLLEGLKERDVKATFFLIGGSIAGREDIVKQMAGDGHLIGSHTFTHVQLTKLPVEEACAEIEKTNEAIQAVTGKKVTYIRPPYGSWDEELSCAVGMTEVGWTVDPRDWEVKNTDKITAHVLSHVEDGSIILLHDVYDTSVEAAFAIIDRLKAEGYAFVTVDGLLLD